MVDLGSVELRRLTDKCTVWISSGGSGFFVGPGLVMSCAHVVADSARAAVRESVAVEWQGLSFAGSIRAAAPERGSSGSWPYPDLCLIELGEVPPEQPWVVLGDFREIDDLEVYLAAFTSQHGARPRLEGRSARLGGPVYEEGGRVWEITGLAVVPGMAGGPVVDLRSGLVCAIAKATRDSRALMGGHVIPASAIRDAFPDVWWRNQAERSRRWSAAQQGLPDDSAAVDELLPEALGETLTSGNVLLVAGPEIPVARRAPGRTELLRLLIERTDDQSINEAGRQQVLASLAAGNLDPATRLLRSRRDGLESLVAEIYAVPSAVPAYDALAQIAFIGVINMSWDSSLLDAFRPRSPVVIRGSSEEVLTAAKSQEFAFTWFAGDPNSEQIAISPGEVRARFFANETLSRFLTGSVQSSSLLFVGVRASDVIDFFDTLTASGAGMSPAETTSQRRYAIGAIDDLWELNRTQLRDGYSVELIGYDPADVGALARIIQRLLDATRLYTAPGGIPTQPRPLGQMLNRVTLTNIGAFERLDLQLGKAWNLLLGINGCGKTTLLRAVALGLCGDHTLALEAGAGLLRTGCGQGLIELQVGSSLFRTELYRAPDTVRVRSSSLSPVEQGSWVVLGFPALRGMSLAAPSGISHPQAPKPRVEDLLPLLRNQVDARLDDIKQWIINVEARRRTGDERARQMLDRFFGVLSDLTPGIMLEFESVDNSSWEVWVRTDDGVVSIDQLSQGMNSIVAWVGTLLQRMYDIYTDSDDPAAEPAFVLIDELDAHLHPTWQRLLPSLTRNHFPRVQFLATSHSPLVAGSLRQGELFVAERAPRASSDGTEYLVATVTATDVDPEGLRADQVLTSPLFGLMTSRSPEFGNKVDRYTQLMTAASRTPEEDAEMQSLKSLIAASYRDGETAAERDAEASQEADLEEALADLEPSEQSVAALRKLADALGEAGGLDET